MGDLWQNLGSTLISKKVANVLSVEVIYGEDTTIFWDTRDQPQGLLALFDAVNAPGFTAAARKAFLLRIGILPILDEKESTGPCR